VLLERRFLEYWRRRDFPVGDILPLASAKSAGETIELMWVRSYRGRGKLTEEVYFMGRDIGF